MMNEPPQIELIVDDFRWRAALPDIETMAQRAVGASFDGAGFNDSVSLSVLLADDERIQTLNREFRNVDKATNVLSFPALETPHLPGQARILGDIALAYDTLFREAETANRTLGNHFLHLIVHASLHLIGYTHELEEDAKHMEALEINVLAGLGVSNPYENAGDRQTAYGTREP